MKTVFFTLFCVAVFSAAIPAASVNCDGSQIIYMAFTERNYNGGGQTYVWCDVNQGALIHFPTASLSAMANAPCTLYISQIALSGKATFSGPTAPRLYLYSVPGTWKSGSSRSTVENGAACYNYRAYDTTPWGGDTAADIFMFAISAGRTNKATLTLREPTDNNGLSYAVLDPEIVNDLATGEASGLFIVNFSTPQVNLNFTRTSAAFPHLSYGIPISTESAAQPTGPFRITAAPNPFSPATTIQFSGTYAEKASLSVFSADGKQVERHTDIRNGLFRCSAGYSLGNGIYIINVSIGEKQYSKPVILQR